MDTEDWLAGRKRPPTEDLPTLYHRLAVQLWDRIDMLWTCHMQNPERAAEVIQAEIAECLHTVGQLAAKFRQDELARVDPTAAAQAMRGAVDDFRAQVDRFATRTMILVAAVPAGLALAFFGLWYFFIRG